MVRAIPTDAGHPTTAPATRCGTQSQLVKRKMLDDLSKQLSDALDVRRIDLETIARLTRESLAFKRELDALKDVPVGVEALVRESQLFKANMERAQKRCEQVGIMVEAVRMAVGFGLHTVLDDVLTVLDAASSEIPACGQCGGPVLGGKWYHRRGCGKASA